MQPVSTNDTKFRPEIIRQKRILGAVYGIVAGLAFAFSTWGWDAFLLYQAHAFLPWTKLIIGCISCAIAGGLAGCLSVWFDKSIITMILWLVLAAVFSWIIVTLPLRTTPLLSERIEPRLQGLLIPGSDATLRLGFQLSFAWIVIFTVLAGVIEIPVVEPAVFSTSFFGKALPCILCAIILGISGTFADNFNNEALRSPIIALDEAIQFVIDNQGKKPDPAISRKMHAGSLRGVSEYVSPERRLIVSSFDDQFGDINVIVMFENGWVTCNVIYSQPVYCEPLPISTP